MEQPRLRLLRTYTGARARPDPGRGRGGRPGLRVLRPPAPWISPQVDPKRLFSTSSSGDVSSSSSTLDNPEFLPPKRRPKAPRRAARKKQQRQRKSARKAKGANENKAPQEDAPRESFVPPTPLCRNVTYRRTARAPRLTLTPVRLRRGAPLLCSTPHLPALESFGVTGGLAEEGEEDEESILQGGGVSGRVSCYFSSGWSCWTRELRKESHTARSNVLSQPSLLKMDRDDKQVMESSSELFEEKDLGREWRASKLLASPCLSRLHCGSFQSHPAGRSRLWSKVDSNSDLREGLRTSPESSVSSPGQGRDPGQSLLASPKTSNAPRLQGAFQLQATISDGKLTLSMPRGASHLPNRRQELSLRVTATPRTKRVAELNGPFSEEASLTDQSSPQLQPVVLLDSQVVPNWLASHPRKRVTHHWASKGECSSQPDSPCTLPGICNSNHVVPMGGAGTTGRRACISGFSSNRWGQHRKLKQGKRKKNVEWKPQTEMPCFQESFTNQKEENPAFVCLSSPDSSFSNVSMWRRIRASLSLHKKKKILSETESCSSSVATSSVRSHFTEVLKTPFTQKLGYSICPSSSMILLSSMTAFSLSEVTLTDAEKVFGECKQKGPVPFEACIPQDKLQKCEKIGEGVFGEVFRTEGENGSVALKIIPIEGSERVNGEPQKTFSEILPEIIISKELSLLADEKENQTCGFIRLYSVHCVKGAYPEPLLNTWDEYCRLKVSENDRPDFFGDQQLFMILEFEFGGTDLENMRCRQLNSVVAAKSILQQVTASLAVAEEALRFEHRDLHWGNVLVKKTNVKEVSMTLNGETRLLPTQGVLVNIIDYTFSRLERDGLTVYCDLSADEEIFQGRGDYQFDIYRQMREENDNKWADYFPHSNILWLHYLANKLLKEVSYRKKATTTSLRQVQKQLKLFSEEVLSYRSAADLLNASSFFQSIH